MAPFDILFVLGVMGRVCIGLVFVTAAIEKLGCECAVMANRMKMVLADGVETRDIFRIAAQQQVRIRRMNFRRDTLEDIFLKAMEN